MGNNKKKQKRKKLTRARLFEIIQIAASILIIYLFFSELLCLKNKVLRKRRTGRKIQVRKSHPDMMV